MIDYKQANPDHTMDQFSEVLKELDDLLDPEIWKVCLLFLVLLTKGHQPQNSSQSTHLEGSWDDGT